ncbi:MAG: flagellar export chaperone FliS [Pseudomonadota bacterium]
MQLNRALNAYRKVGVESAVMDASPYQLITMLMEGALDRIASARGAMERGETATQGEMIGKAISIIDTMRASLDHEKGGDLAGRLSDLYEYMEMRLLDARRENDPSMLTEVAGLMREVKSGWDGIPAQYR